MVVFVELVVIVEGGLVEIVGVEVVGFGVGVVVVLGVVDVFKVVGSGGGLWYLVLPLWVFRALRRCRGAYDSVSTRTSFLISRLKTRGTLFFE